MKKKVDLNLVTGDENLVTIHETYVAFDENNNISALKRRNDAGDLEQILVPVSGTSVTEDPAEEPSSVPTK